MEALVYWYSLIVGDILTPAIFILFVLGIILLFKRHYLVESEHQFAVSLQKGVTDYIQELYKQEQVKEFSQIVWEILKQAREKRRMHAEAAECAEKHGRSGLARPKMKNRKKHIQNISPPAEQTKT